MKELTAIPLLALTCAAGANTPNAWDTIRYTNGSSSTWNILPYNTDLTRTFYGKVVLELPGSITHCDAEVDLRFRLVDVNGDSPGYIQDDVLHITPTRYEFKAGSFQCNFYVDSFFSFPAKARSTDSFNYIDNTLSPGNYRNSFTGLLPSVEFAFPMTPRYHSYLNILFTLRGGALASGVPEPEAELSIFTPPGTWGAFVVFEGKALPTHNISLW